MMVTWKRLQVLVLLVCGLATAPFGSLEQSDAVDNQNAIMPCLSTAGATPLSLHTPNGRAELALRPYATLVEWFLPVSEAEWCCAAVHVPAEHARNLTYDANAPPSPLI